jgi:long-chain acyl-CoA synthetase
VKELVFPRLLLPAADRAGDTGGFHDDGVWEPLGTHVERSLRLAHAHRHALGLGPESRFAVLAGASRHYVNLWHAALLGGGVLNPVNSRLAPPEIAFILRDSSSEVCYVDRTFAPVVESLRAQLPDLRQVILVEPDDAHPVPCDTTYDEVAAAGDPTWARREPEEDDLVMCMYTGGTTGLPKGVLHTQRTMTLNVYRMAQMFGYFQRRIRYLNATPMFHVGGSMGTMGTPAGGGVVVVQRVFDPAGAVELIERHGIDTTGLVPTMVNLILSSPAFSPERLRTLRTLGYGASPMPSGVLDRVLAELPWVDVQQTYGMTEAAAVLTCLSPDDHRAGGPRLRSAGRAMPGVALMIADDDGNPLPDGEVGEVCARAGSFMVGYLNRPEETAAVFRDGWYRTGDVGLLDTEGYLTLVDRAKDMIVTGAENVYSTEVESALSSHPAVLEVAVIGIPSAQWGEQVHAVVAVRPGTAVTEAELIAHCRNLIAGFKVPKSVELRDEPLPKSGAMKILKRELRAPYWEGRDRRID